MIMSVWFFIIIVPVFIGLGLLFLHKVYLPKKIEYLKNKIKGQQEIIASKDREIQLKERKIEEGEELIRRYESNMGTFVELLRLKPNFADDNSVANSESLERFVSAILETYPSEANMANKNEYFQRQNMARDAYDIVRDLQIYMVNIKRELQDQTPPLTTEQKRSNLIKLLDMSMMSYDLITSFYNINAREEQNLNKKILDGSITRTQALHQALTITNIPTETPRWLRVIKESVEWTGVGDCEVIFSGYKL